MALMRAAAGAASLDADHAVADVAHCDDMGLVKRGPEARPAGAALELGLGPKQRQAAQAAAVDPVFLVAEEAAAERRLGAVMEQNVALLLAEVGFQARALGVAGRGQVEGRSLGAVGHVQSLQTA